MQAAALAAENETLRADKRVAALEAELDGVRRELASVSMRFLYDCIGSRLSRNAVGCIRSYDQGRGNERDEEEVFTSHGQNGRFTGAAYLSA